MLVVIVIMFHLFVEVIGESACDSMAVSVQAIAPAQALLQTHHAVSQGERPPLENVSKAPVSWLRHGFSKVNPSGAAAPLNDVGYFAVADRNCQAEMRQLIERQVRNLGYEVCDISGLFGIVLYHSRPILQDFAKLTADILADSVDRCTWLAKSTEDCQPRPDDCPEFRGVIPADCGCRRSQAAKLNFAGSTIVHNNIGGVGPSTSDPEELRISGGRTALGQPFDLVITAVGTYTAHNPSATGIIGGFAKINIKCSTNTTFKFSFVTPGTNTPLQVSEVHMAMFDLDGAVGPFSGIESASSSGYSGYVTDANPAVSASLDNSTGVTRTQFQAPGSGDITNPSDPKTLTDLQRRNSIMFFYKEISEFEVDFIVDGGDKGRNLFFAFESALDDRCSA